MGNYGVGFFIRRKREGEGWTQEELSNGICDRSTLSRIEKGQVLDEVILLKLLERLGVPSERFQVFMSQENFEIAQMKKEIVADNCDKRFSRALEKIRKLEENTSEDDLFTNQFLLRARAAAGYEENGEHRAYDIPTQREMLIQSLELTEPGIRTKDINSFLFGEEEIKILNQIAITYAEEENRPKAIAMYRFVMNYLQNHFVDGEIRAVALPLIAYNYSKYLGMEHRYEEAIEVAEQGRRCCIRYNKCRMLGGLLLNLGCCYHDIGQEEKSRDLIARSYNSYQEMENGSAAQKVKEYARETLGMEL